MCQDLLQSVDWNAAKEAMMDDSPVVHHDRRQAVPNNDAGMDSVQDPSMPKHILPGPMSPENRVGTTATATATATRIRNGDGNHDNESGVDNGHDEATLTILDNNHHHGQGMSTDSTQRASSHSHHHRRLVVDIMSVGSQTRPEYQQAQRETWGAHPTVRHFFPITEADDRDSKCAANLTRDHIRDNVIQCRVFQQQAGRFMQLFKYMPASWVMRQGNPVGWYCAQYRWGNGLVKIARYYRKQMKRERQLRRQPQNTTTATVQTALPDAFMIVDDDTLHDMEVMEEALMSTLSVDNNVTGTGNATANKPTAERPIVYGGCLEVTKSRKLLRIVPHGGSGLILSRGALERLIRPINCTGRGGGANSQESESNQSTTTNAPSPTFEDSFCAQIQENLVLEAPVWRDGYSLADFIDAFAYEQNYTTGTASNTNDTGSIHSSNPLGSFNCYISDQLLAYFFNFYYISEPWIEGSRHFRQFGPTRAKYDKYWRCSLHPYLGNFQWLVNEWDTALPPGAEQYECKIDHYSECSLANHSTICHKVNDAMMRKAMAT